MRKFLILTFIAIGAVGAQVVQTNIKNGKLQTDLNANNFSIINLNPSFATSLGAATTTFVNQAVAAETAARIAAQSAIVGQLSLPNVGTSGTKTFATGDSITTDAQGRVISTVMVVTRTLTAGSGLTGGGTIALDRTISLGTPSTLSVSSANSVSGTTHSHAITASSNPGTGAALLKSASDGTLTLTSLKAYQPVFELANTTATQINLGGETTTLNIGAESAQIVFGSLATLRSADYASQTTGWKLGGEDRGLDVRYVYADEMHVKSFIADLEQALAGGQIISKSVAVMATPFTAPAAGGTATLIVRDLPSAPNMAVFQSGDQVVVRSFSRANGSLDVSDGVGVVTSYVDRSGADEGQQQWTYTRNASPNAGQMTAGTVIAPEAIVLDFGTTGNGYYEVSAIDGANGINSPYAQIVTWTTAPTAQNRSLRTRFGNLRGITGTANEFGLLAGTYNSVNGQYFRASNQAFELHGINLSLWSSTNEVIRLDRTAPSFALGNPLPSAYGTGIGVWMGKDVSDSLYKFRVGNPAGNKMTWDGSLLTVTGAINVTGGNAETTTGSQTKADAAQTSATAVANTKALKDLSDTTVNWAGAGARGGPANTIVGQGTLATLNSAAWGTNITGRPVELTDGRIVTALNSSGTVVTRVVPASVAAPGASGLYLGSDRMGYYNGSIWRTYMDNGGGFYLAGSGSNALTWDGTTLSINGTVNITGGNAAKTDLSNTSVNWAGAATLGGAANSIVGQGSLATSNSAAWATQLTGRPVELTDGRITTALNSSGTVLTKVVPSALAAPGSSGLYLGSDYLGFYNGSAWRTYMQSNGNFFLTGTGSNALTWDGTTLSINGSINVTGGNAETTTGSQTKANAAETNSTAVANTKASKNLSDTTVNWAGSAVLGGNANDTALVNGVAASTVQGGSARANLGLTTTGGVTLPVTATPSGTGLFLGSDYMGYYTAGAWKTFIQSNGRFYLGGTSGALQWDGSNLLINGGGTFSGALSAATGTFSGSVTTSNITATGGTIGGWTIGASRISNTNVFLDNAGQYLSMGTSPPTSYGANIGVYLDGGVAGGRVSLYKDAGNFLQWDGSKLTIASSSLSLDATGNLTLGQVAASKANIYWNNANQRLEFRSNTTVHSYINTDGGFVTGDGGVNIGPIGMGFANNYQITWANGSIFYNSESGSPITSTSTYRAATDDVTGLAVNSIQASNSIAGGNTVIGTYAYGAGHATRANQGYVSISRTAGTFNGVTIGSTAIPTHMLDVYGTASFTGQVDTTRLSVNGGYTNQSGDVGAARSGGASGVYYFGTSGSNYLYYDGVNFTLSGGTLYGTFNGGLTGNASTASVASKLAGQGSSGTWTTDFNNLPANYQNYTETSSGGPSGNWWFQQNFRHSNGTSQWGSQIAWGWEDNAGKIYYRNVSGGTWSSWNQIHINGMTNDATFGGSVKFTSYLYGDNKIAISSGDAYLRINESSSFSSGVWFGASRVMLGGGGFGIGSNGGSTNSKVWITGDYDGSNSITINGNAGTITTAGAITSAGMNITAGTDYSASGVTIVRVSDNINTVLNPVTNAGGIYINWSRGTAGAGVTIGDGNFGSNIVFAQGGGVRFVTYGTGTATFDASGNITSSSDERLKTINGQFTRGLDDLRGVKPITYHWKKETGLDQTESYSGFSAQNLLANIPESVGLNPSGTYSANTTPIVAALVNSVNELEARLAKLEGAGAPPPEVIDHKKRSTDRVLELKKHADERKALPKLIGPAPDPVKPSKTKT